MRQTIAFLPSLKAAKVDFNEHQWSLSSFLSDFDICISRVKATPNDIPTAKINQKPASVGFVSILE